MKISVFVLAFALVTAFAFTPGYARAGDNMSGILGGGTRPTPASVIPVPGTGNRVAKFITPTTIGDSCTSDNGTTINGTTGGCTAAIQPPMTFQTATATDDKILIQPKTGGAATFTGTLTSRDLTGNRTWTFPNDTLEVAGLDVANQVFSTAQIFRLGITVSTATATNDQLATAITPGGAARFTGTFTNADFTAARTYTMPDASGTVALQTGTFTQNSVIFAGASGVLDQDNAKFSWNDSTFVFTVVGSEVITGGALASGAMVLSSTATLSSANATQNPVFFNITTAGSNAVQQAGLRVNMLAGYTGTNESVGVIVGNITAGTGSTPFTDTTANVGVHGGTVVTTAGTNVGVYGDAIGGNVNYGVAGRATTDKAAIPNVGVAGVAKNEGAGGIRIGGFFGLLSASGDPTLGASAALVADNGSVAVTVFSARSNNTEVFAVANGGGGTFSTTTSTDDQIVVSVTAGGAARFAGTITGFDVTANRTWKFSDKDTFPYSTTCVMNGGATATCSATGVPNTATCTCSPTAAVATCFIPATGTTRTVTSGLPTDTQVFAIVCN